MKLQAKVLARYVESHIMHSLNWNHSYTPWCSSMNRHNLRESILIASGTDKGWKISCCCPRLCGCPFRAVWLFWRWYCSILPSVLSFLSILRSSLSCSSLVRFQLQMYFICSDHVQTMFSPCFIIICTFTYIHAQQVYVTTYVIILRNLCMEHNVEMNV